MFFLSFNLSSHVCYDETRVYFPKEAKHVSPLCDRAVEAAKYHAKREEHVKVYLIHVIPSTGPRTNAHRSKSIREELIRENQPKVDQLVESFIQQNIETAAEILVADNNENPGKLICKYAEVHDIE